MLAALAEGQLVLGRYGLGKRIGAGASGSVFRAVDARSGQDVVVKFFDGQEDGFSPWASEMRLALRLRHKNIAACLDVGFDERQELWALVFEQAKGGSLRRALAAGRRFTGLDCTRILLDIASALSYAHGQGVVHRDVKPENILAQDSGEETAWLLTDFGAGRFLAPGEVARSLAGSIEYMAPEVLTQGATAVSDQFSLGILGMELWLGRLPGQDERPGLVASMRDQPGLLGIIGRLCESDPQRRFLEMAEVVNRLQQELMEMTSGGDIIESLYRYLGERHGLSKDAQQSLVSEWGQRGSFADFLVNKNLLPRSTARAIDAVRNGYVDMSLESILGLSTGPQASPDSASLPVTAAAQPTEAAPAAAPAPPSAPAPVVVAPAEAAPDAVQSPRPVEVGKPRRPAKLMSGLRLGRYTLQEPLGEGATATVFRSFHEMLNLPIAIKVFAPIDFSSDPDAPQRFRSEAQTLVRLEHPHVVRVLDVDIFEQYPFIVMEYVGETTLASQIQNLGRLPAVRIAQIGIAVADALQAAWKEGLLHRDVKPSNIIERKDGHIKLVDFGIAAKRTSAGDLNDPLAALGLVSGTPSYIAPEQVERPNSIDFHADMYGLGATLYHAAVGRPPFSRATAYDTVMAQIKEEVTPITQIEPSFDLHLAWTIHRMLRKQPEERFASWAEVKEALTHTLFFHDQPEVSFSGSFSPARSGGKTTTTDFLGSPQPAVGKSELAISTPGSEDTSRARPAKVGSSAPVPFRPIAARALLPRALLTRWLELPMLWRWGGAGTVLLLLLLLLTLLLLGRGRA